MKMSKNAKKAIAALAAAMMIFSQCFAEPEIINIGEPIKAAEEQTEVLQPDAEPEQDEEIKPEEEKTEEENAEEGEKKPDESADLKESTAEENAADGLTAALASQKRITVTLREDGSLIKSVKMMSGEVIKPWELVETSGVRGYTYRWTYNGETIGEEGLLLSADMKNRITLNYEKTAIDYLVRIDYGEHGKLKESLRFNPSVYERVISERDGETPEVWEGRYDIESHGYGRDDETGEDHASKTYDGGKQYYYAVAFKPETDDGWYFTGWEIKYYNDDFTEEEIIDNNGDGKEDRQTSFSNTSGSANLGNPGADPENPNDVTRAMFGNCVLKALYTEKATVVALPKGDSVHSGYKSVSNYNPREYEGYAIELMGGTKQAVKKLSSKEEVERISGDESETNFLLYDYYAVPEGSHLSFWIRLSAGFSQRAKSFSVGTGYRLDGRDLFGYPSDRGDKRTDFNVYANGEKISSLDVYESGIIYSLSAAELEEKGNGIIKISVSDLYPNMVQARTTDTTKEKASDPDNYKLVFDESDEDYLGEIARFHVSNTATGEGSFAAALPTFKWGGTVHFRVEDKEGNTVKDGIRVLISNRLRYSNMETQSYYHYGAEQSVRNGEYIVYYPDENGVYTLNYKGNDRYADSVYIKIESYTLDDYKEAAVKELYNTAHFEYNIYGSSSSYGELLGAYLKGFWNITGKGNLRYSGRTTEFYKGKYIIGGKEITAAEAKEYVDSLPPAPPGQSNYICGWATNTSMWAAYFPEDTLDEAGEAVYEALFEIKAAEDVQQLRRILSPDSEYIKRIKAAMARGTKEYNEYNEKNLANKLEKEYAARLENNSFCIAEISGITEEELSECSEYIVNINSSENSGKVSAKFATEDFLKLADNGKALTVKSNIGVIELSAQAVKNIASSERLKAGGFVAASSAVYINITALKPGETYGLTKAQTEAIGDKKVFDLTVTNARGAVIALENAPVTVSVPYTLVEGEEIGSIKVWYINNAGEAEYVGADSYEYDEGENLWVTFTTTHFSAYVVAKAVTTTVRHAGSAPRKVSLAKKTSLNKNELLENALFSDVLSKHWAYEYIKFASEKNLLKAKDGAFEPEKALSGTDLEAAFEALGAKKPNLEPGSKELTKEEFAKALAAYAENEGEKISGGAAEWAVEKGILETSSNGKLNKNAAISRAEAAKGLYVLAGGR